MPDLQTEERTIDQQNVVEPTKIIVEKPICGNRGLIVLTLMISLLALIVGSVGLYLQFIDRAVEEETPPVTEAVEEEQEPVEFILVHGSQVEVHPEIPVNPYDMEAISYEDGFALYEDAKRGIDVSQHQGEIDWAKVAGDGVEFAFLRLGFRGYGDEGNIHLDSMFYDNLAGAQENGIAVGVYFFSQATSVWEAQEEAYYVLDVLDGAELELPVVFDWEFISGSTTARTNGTRGKSITLYMQAFNEAIEAGGYEPCVYFNMNLAYLYLELQELADYPFWLAAYREVPDFHYGFDIWQYSDTGRVDGIDGAVDLNLMFTDMIE